MIAMNPTNLGRIALAMGLGACGGFVANWLTLPLPWMLGAMITCTAASIIGLPIQGPMPLRQPMIMVLGVMLGAGFSPDMADRAGEWLISLAFLAAFVGVAGLSAYPFFRKIGGYDRPTAYFSAMPGGLNEMMIVGGAMGGDDRRIVLTHASRILLTVLIVPVVFRFVSDIDMTDRSRFGVALSAVAWQDYLILGACGLVGYPIAKVLRIPAPMLVGPMLASASLHLAGMTAATPPLEIVNCAQWIMGTIIGCRFVGVARSEVFRTIALGMGSTVIILTATVFFALLVYEVGGVPFQSAVLAYSPGGLAEMSLVALALGVDVAFVATHHIVRIVYVVVAAPIIYKMFLHKEPPETDLPTQ
ncbi:MAG TPA: AbrB family transcriptional regulator [Rhodospirillaceae bacterium]|nr:AbrB family transcriptional regulator [Rhodospirillaceae bacterium]